MQPHCEQSGLPPYWHGVMAFSRSADRHSVVFEKMHSSGFLGGFKYPRTTDGIMSCSFGSLAYNETISSTSSFLSAGRKRSTESSPCCGVYRLNQIRFTSGLDAQKRV